MERINAFSVVMVRTEVGKALRKQYENHLLHHRFNEHREMHVGGVISNTITTVQKDFLICEIWKKLESGKQQNKDGLSAK